MLVLSGMAKVWSVHIVVRTAANASLKVTASLLYRVPNARRWSRPYAITPIDGFVLWWASLADLGCDQITTLPAGMKSTISADLGGRSQAYCRCRGVAPTSPIGVTTYVVTPYSGVVTWVHGYCTDDLPRHKVHQKSLQSVLTRSRCCDDLVLLFVARISVGFDACNVVHRTVSGRHQCCPDDVADYP